MENLKWIFEGIGTEIVSLVVGLVVGGISGYRIAIKKSGKQKQTAEDYTKQKQVLEIEATDKSKEGEKKNVNFSQVQKAGKNSEQSQVGKVRR